ncbi:AMP-binding protein [Novosphingobium sp.]|uniref:AMP-binding protein n=1 Tax=Novosphingobium sp. TaxID=1874826 RepID=UPI0025F41A77|nr:AMP-binding protein [Novosphingobium sp.]MCC6925280.1 AMP-binding protein [Novosphingobium sp.]
MNTASLWANALAGGKAEFIALPDGRIDFAGFAQMVRRWCGWFDAAGIAEGERVLIRTGSDVVAASGFIAALLDGVVPVLMTGDTPDLRALAVAEVVAAKGFAADHLPAGQPGIEIRPEAGGGWFSRKLDPLGGLPETGRDPRLPLDPDGLAYVLFTSGTTSSPSGVQITRGNLFANLATLSRLFGYGAQSRIFNDMILAHADGMIQGPVIALANRCAVIRSGGFTIAGMEKWLGRVRLARASHVITVPTIWAMIDAYAAHDDYFDARECTHLMSVAAKLPEALWTRLESRFGRPVFNQYGLTETVASALYAGPQAEMGAFGTVGKPVDCEARIDPLASGSEGELQLKGAHIFPGYWQDAERTRASFTDDGWLKTGDLARLRDDGSFEVLARIKSVIMMGGFLIRPDEIDEAMLRHPKVRESVTVGIEDAMFDEVPVTAVVCHEPASEEELTAHARAYLEGQKVPKRIVVLDAIPRGDSGKARLAELRDLLAAATGQHAPQPAAPGDDLDSAVLALAGEVFRVDPATIALDSRPGQVPGWDSFSQLNFLMAAEERFAVAIPASRVAQIVTIADMVEAIRQQQR